MSILIDDPSLEAALDAWIARQQIRCSKTHAANQLLRHSLLLPASTVKSRPKRLPVDPNEATKENS